MKIVPETVCTLCALYKCKNSDTNAAWRKKLRQISFVCRLLCVYFFNQCAPKTTQWNGNIVRKSVRGNCTFEMKWGRNWIRTLDPRAAPPKIAFLMYSLTLCCCLEQWPSRHHCFAFFYFINVPFQFNPNGAFFLSSAFVFLVPFSFIFRRPFVLYTLTHNICYFECSK